MQSPWPIMQSLQNFFQLNFLFAGLEVSSTTLLLSRLLFFLIITAGLGWFTFKIILKVLECIQEFLKSVAPIPKSFFLFLILAVPLSPESIGSKWIGYILLLALMLGIVLAACVLIAIYKYGVDQAIRFVNYLRFRGASASETRPAASGQVVPVMDYGPQG